MKLYCQECGKEIIENGTNTEIFCSQDCLDEAEDKHYEEMSNALLGVSNDECRSCGGGGCVDCETERFI